MLLHAPHIRYHIGAMLAAHWIEFVSQHKRWIPDKVGIVFENVRNVLACPTYARRGGVVIPGICKNIHAEIVKACPERSRRIDPKTLDPDTEVMRF